MTKEDNKNNEIGAESQLSLIVPWIHRTLHGVLMGPLRVLIDSGGVSA